MVLVPGGGRGRCDRRGRKEIESGLRMTTARRVQIRSVRGRPGADCDGPGNQGRSCSGVGAGLASMTVRCRRLRRGRAAPPYAGRSTQTVPNAAK